MIDFFKEIILSKLEAPERLINKDGSYKMLAHQIDLDVSEFTRSLFNRYRKYDKRDLILIVLSAVNSFQKEN
jgi:hypothetical protein